MFSARRPVLGTRDIAEIASAARSTMHRYASTLARLGVLERNGNHKYRLSSRAADPGLSLIGTMRKALPVAAVLQELQEQTRYTVGLGVLTGTHVIYLYRLRGHRPGQYAIDDGIGVGIHIPAYGTAVGKAILASLPDAARRRIVAELNFVPYGPRSVLNAVDLLAELERLDYREPVVCDEEFVVGARSIAMYVPRSSEERPIAVDVTVPSAVMTASELLKQVGPSLRSAASVISQTRADDR